MGNRFVILSAAKDDKLLADVCGRPAWRFMNRQRIPILQDDKCDVR
jgi:hypothetical protein